MVKKKIKVIEWQYQNTVARIKTSTQIRGGILMTDTDPIKRAGSDMMFFQKFLNRRFNPSLLGKIIL